jgi:hypothetical protein
MLGSMLRQTGPEMEISQNSTFPNRNLGTRKIIKNFVELYDLCGLCVKII